MKTIFKALACLLMLSSTALAQGHEHGDRWPWNWGSECPFPFTAIDGNWELDAHGKEDTFSGHSLAIGIVTERQSDQRDLTVQHFDVNGRLISSGTAKLTNDAQKTITVSLRHPRTDQILNKVILRTYVFAVDENDRARAPERNACVRRKKAFAATFCPVGGRRCLEDSKYLMERIP